jgi:hypothetical protein
VVNPNNLRYKGWTARGAALFAVIALVTLLVGPGAALAAPAPPSTGDNLPVTIPGQEKLAPVELPPAVADPAAASAPTSADASVWLSSFCTSTGEICKTGDFNNDGKEDVVRFLRSTVAGAGVGDVFVALSDGTKFNPATLWHDAFCVGQEECRVADINGDGRDDIVSFVRGTSGTVWVALSTGNGFGASYVARTNFCVLDEVCETGDFNGDGGDDIVAFARNSARVWIALSNGATFGPASIWNTNFVFCGPGEVCTTGDFNGDGRDDVIAFARAYGAVWVATSTGAALNQSSLWNQSIFCYGLEECRVGDFNGDGRDDISAFLRSTQLEPKRGDVYVGLSTGSAFQNGQLWHDFFCLLSETCAVGDVNGDGRADLLSFSHGSTGSVWVELSPGPPPPPSKWIVSMFIRLIK